MSYNVGQYRKQDFVQLILGSWVFSLPGLRNARHSWYMKNFHVGSNCSIASGVSITKAHYLKNEDASVRIGSNVRIGAKSFIDYTGGIVIEDDVWIGPRTVIYTHGHNIPGRELKSSYPTVYSFLRIEKDAWIGSNSIILGKVEEIGKGAIIAAGSVVTKNVKDYEIVAGNPANKIGERI